MNGLVERFHRHLKSALMARLSGHNWVDELPWVLLGICTELKEDLHASSAELVYGTPLAVPGEFIPAPRGQEEEPAAVLDRLRERLGNLAPVPTSQHRQTPTHVPKDLQNWVCLANYESAFQTNAIHYERNSAGNIWSADFGIFQINSYWWCYEPGFPSAGNGCNVYCQDLYDVQTAINCAAIVAEQQGMKAWVSWVDNCEGRSIQHFVEGC
ncbi:uncharacterized protein LOC132392411 [Hypanus sabinus]|uniref:uncharacterized protein LOC132392411 n=1 Tax=Hypanus sabinus TaxID=79690 RepID=UPI0028C44CFC|nr:uncharacterized protein LOC132392411 [Hypanus sabinus]